MHLEPGEWLTVRHTTLLEAHPTNNYGIGLRFDRNSNLSRNRDCRCTLGALWDRKISHSQRHMGYGQLGIRSCARVPACCKSAAVSPSSDTGASFALSSPAPASHHRGRWAPGSL